MKIRLRPIFQVLIIWLALSALHGLSGCRGLMTSSLSKNYIKQDSRMNAVTEAFLFQDTLYLEFRDEQGNPMAASAKVDELADEFGEPMRFRFERMRNLPKIVHSTRIPVVAIPDSINYHSDKEILNFLSSYGDDPSVIGVSHKTGGYQLIGLAIPLPRYGNYGETSIRRPPNPGGFYRTTSDWISFLFLYPFAVIGDVFTFWIVPIFP